jgi:hypothetical protein
LEIWTGFPQFGKIEYFLNDFEHLAPQRDRRGGRILIKSKKNLCGVKKVVDLPAGCPYTPKSAKAVRFGFP